MHANSLSVRVGHSERSMIGLTILAFQISPLPLGIPSFRRSPELGDEGHHLFILQCHRLEATAEAHELFHLLRYGVINTLRDPDEAKREADQKTLSAASFRFLRLSWFKPARNTASSALVGPAQWSSSAR